MSSTLNPNQKGNGTANFTCAVCCRAFHRPDHLARHVRSHNNVRPFRCEVCGRTFGRRDVLLRHADQVHREHSDRKKDASAFRLTQSNEGLGGDEFSFVGRSQSIPKRQRIGGNSPATQAVDFARHSPAHEIVDGIEKVASLRGAEFDDFVQRLSGVSSYADLTRVLRKQALPQLNETPIQIYPSILAGHYARHIRIPYTPHSLQVASTYPVTSLSEYTVDRLLQSYRENFPFPWIHFPTWDLSAASLLREQPYDGQTHRLCHGWKRQPHRLVLISMLALGASCCQETALALDLYQQVRKGILGWVSRAREEPLPQAFFQAFIGYLAFGITFGDKSLEDLTIGHTISLRALVRDAALDKPKATADEPAVCGCGCCADKSVSQWLRWVRVEERKRTFFAYFSLLSSTLMYLNSVATVDWREVGYELPCGEQVWLADSSSAWSEAIRTDPMQPQFAKAVRHLFENDAAADDQSRAFGPHSTSNGYRGRRQHMDRLLQTEMSCFLLITAIHYEAFHARTQPGPYYDNADEALERWQALWTKTCADMSSEHVERLMSCSTAMFNHTQLVLQANIEEARESLMSRRFKKLHILFLFPDRSPQTGYPFDLPWTADEDQLIENMFFMSEHRSAFRHLATSALSALEQSVISVSEESQRVQISLHVAASMFYNIQCLCSWLCFFAHCLDRGLYGGDFGWDDNADAKDSHLLESILSFAQNRKREFNASYEILSSPDDFDRNKAGRLACDLLDVHHHILSQCRTWPLFDHVGDALKGRSLAISDWIDAN
ncbi:unnamed protein product [Clonostachys rhizophaga]|uniref:C2H2-type domain-containing protein n=1 Tax=Clonostachys rhizophaga TaxID=160324 RepID=A0A9N9YJ50_9HYPO|nr:unnamed protein product [Clonostachys rhizophaga]